jgi:hypothetical protein
METLAKCRGLFRSGDWLISADLRSGYYHVNISEEDQEYLGFQFEGQYYVFTSLPFGLGSAPYAFTMLTRQMVKHWRSLGIRLIHYLDDYLWMAPTRELALLLAQRVRADMAALGFYVNDEKSQFEPTQLLEHLGFMVDTGRMVFDVPDRRRAKLLAVAQDLLSYARSHDGRVVARQASRVAGHIQSLFLALGPITRLRTRYLNRDMRPALTGTLSWNRHITLSDEAHQDVAFWVHTLHTLPPQPIVAPRPQPAHVLYTDAGENSWGATLYMGSGYFQPSARPSHPPPLVARADFTAAERVRDSTFRELTGIVGALRTFGGALRGQEFLIRTDSQAAVRIWCRGGSQALDLEGCLYIQDLVLTLDTLIKELAVTPHFQWVPRDLNELADFWSKFKDHGDVMLTSHWFHILDQRWGPHSVDRMASAANARLPRFYSRFYSEGAEGVDCFLVEDWSSENNYIHPDFNMVARVIDHMSRCQARGTLIVPDWPSASWWPILFPACNEGLPSPVVDRIELPHAAFVAAHSETVMKGDGRPPFRLWAVRVDFSIATIH